MTKTIGFRAHCKKGTHELKEGQMYRIVSIGGCYAAYDDKGMITTTINGRSSFEEHFSLIDKPRPRKDDTSKPKPKTKWRNKHGRGSARVH